MWSGWTDPDCGSSGLGLSGGGDSRILASPPAPIRAQSGPTGQGEGAAGDWLAHPPLNCDGGLNRSGDSWEERLWVIANGLAPVQSGELAGEGATG